jgi:hypothetical protein
MSNKKSKKTKTMTPEEERQFVLNLYREFPGDTIEDLLLIQQRMIDAGLAPPNEPGVNLLTVSIEVFPDDEPLFTLHSNDASMPDPICEMVGIEEAVAAFGRLLSTSAADAEEVTDEGNGGD